MEATKTKKEKDIPQRVPIKDKILVVRIATANAMWNKHLPNPLGMEEKVIVSSDQTDVDRGYVRVRHGKGTEKVESIFCVRHFKTLSGKEVVFEQ